MTFQLTLPARFAAQSTVVRPQIILSIDGIPNYFGAVAIYEYVRIGQPNLYIDNFDGDPWTIGGLKLLDDQSDYVSLGGAGAGTTTRITQQVQPDKGIGSSVQQMTLSLIDKNDEISKLISPGFDVSEILGRKAEVFIGFQDTAFPEDFITIFKGYIEDIDSGPGAIKLTLSSPEQRKRQQLLNFTTEQTVLFLGAGSTEIDPTDADSFLETITGPDGSTVDPNCTLYVRIDDELIRYTFIDGSENLNGLTRGALGTTATTHDAGSEIQQAIRLEGNPLDIARKLMLSGWSGPWLTGLDITHFNFISPVDIVANSIFFFGVDLARDYGIYKGDFITTTGAANGANNVSNKEILEVVQTNDGTYIVVSGVTFANELNSAGTISFRSKWDTLPFGCKMTPDDVDLAEFDRLYSLFLSGPNMDFLITEPFDAKEFIEQELLRPIAAYTVSRKGRVSVGYHIGPIPGSDILTIDQSNVENAASLRIRRSLSRNFFNAIYYEIDSDRLEGDFIRTLTFKDNTSITDFNVGERSMVIKASGMRTSVGSPAIAQQAANRYLRRYKRGAEFFDNVEVRFGDAFNLEVGDIVLFDTNSLQVTDTTEGNRSGVIRFFQVINKGMDLRTGKVTLSLVDSAVDTSVRIGLIAPVSLVKSGTSQTKFEIQKSFSAPFGDNEFLKWTRFLPTFSVRVRSPDGVTRNAVREVQGISGNTFTLKTALGFTPQAGDLVEFPHYNDFSESQKLVYAAMRDTDPFDDGKNRYNML